MPLVTRSGEEFASFSSTPTRLGRRPPQTQRRQRRRRDVSRRAIIIILAALALAPIRVPGADASPRAEISAGSKKTPPPPTATTTPQRNNRLFGTIKMAPKSSSEVADSSGGGDASALRELKETLKSQSKQIDALKKQLAALQKTDGAPKKSSAPSSGGHGAHGGGGGGDVEEEIHDYLDRPFIELARHRVGWLSLFLASLSLTALIMNGFEHTLSRQIELAYFVPLLAGHGGNTGGQTVGTVLAAMSSGVVDQKDAGRVIGKEAASGMSMGLVLGVLVSTVARFVMGVSSHVSTVVLFTIPLVSTIASTLASGLPFMCVAMGLDPTVIAAPAMTSFVDVTGLLSYFLIAQAVFKVFGLEL